MLLKPNLKIFQQRLKIRSQTKSTEAKLSSIQEKFGVLKNTVAETANNNLEELKETIVPVVKEYVVKEVKTEVKGEFSAMDAIWKGNLADKVWDAEHNLIVFIFNHNVSKSLMDDSKVFLEKEMQVSSDTLDKLYLKRASRLG